MKKVIETMYDIFEIIMMTGELIARFFIAITTIYMFGEITKETTISPIVQTLIIISIITYIAKPIIGFVNEVKIEKEIEKIVEAKNEKEDNNNKTNKPKQ